MRKGGAGHIFDPLGASAYPQIGFIPSKDSDFLLGFRIHAKIAVFLQ